MTLEGKTGAKIDR